MNTYNHILLVTSYNEDVADKVIREEKRMGLVCAYFTIAQEIKKS